MSVAGGRRRRMLLPLAILLLLQWRCCRPPAAQSSMTRPRAGGGYDPGANIGLYSMDPTGAMMAVGPAGAREVAAPPV